MARYDEPTLIAESPKAHGVHAKPEYKERTVFCAVRSVGMQEAYLSASSGLRPELKFDLTVQEEYEGEKLCRYRGVLYDVIRAYSDGGKVELTVQRSNASV